MSNLSLMCGLGYIVAVNVILLITGSTDDFSVWAVAVVGGGLLGYHCARCDRAEGRV